MTVMRVGRTAVAFVVVLAASAVFTFPSAGAAAVNDIEAPRAMPLGTVGGVEVVQYDGIFSGETSTGAFRVPYRITAPSNAGLVNGAVVVEVPHDVVGLGTLDFYLGRAFLVGRGFVHAGVGYSTAGFGAGLQILDPAVPGTFIEGGYAEGAGRTDDEIVADFAAALAVDPDARVMVGRVRNPYVTGFSAAAESVLRLVTSGQAEGVFDLAVPVTILGSYDPQAALSGGVYTGKVVIVNSAFEPSASFEDTGGNPDRYRFYAVEGTPHVPDPLQPLFSNETTPASFLPALRAHFLQAHRWVRQGDAPPSSHGTGSGTLLPIVQLGEATFHTGFLGSYDDVQTITQLGFASHAAYLRAFNAAVDAYARSGEILRNEASDMKRRAALCPPLTYTETYREHYTDFVDITAC